jgi:hypothetical protein
MGDDIKKGSERSRVSGAGYDPVADHCEHGNDCLGSIQCRYFIDELSDFTISRPLVSNRNIVKFHKKSSYCLFCPVLSTFIAVVLLQMSKKICKLEKETSSWKQRWEKSHQALLEMAADKQQRDGELALATRQLAQLQKLCRTLQAERTSLLAQIKAEEVAKTGAEGGASVIGWFLSEGSFTFALCQLIIIS